MRIRNPFRKRWAVLVCLAGRTEHVQVLRQEGIYWLRSSAVLHAAALASPIGGNYDARFLAVERV